jgi:hypothetical protein
MRECRGGKVGKKKGCRGRDEEVKSGRKEFYSHVVNGSLL